MWAQRLFLRNRIICNHHRRFYHSTPMSTQGKPLVLVIHGAGMNMRGKVNVAQFGTMTLPEYETAIVSFAKELDVEVEFFHSNIEGEVINRLYKEYDDRRVKGVLFNPGAYTCGYRALNQAIGQVNGEGKIIPIIEVHISNPSTKGTISEVAPNCVGSITGFGVFGYKIALQALLNLIINKQ